MSEAENTTQQSDQQQQSSDNGGQDSGFTPPATQEELNKLIGERVQRERQKFADYGDLKAKAAKLDEIETANKTELEKVTEQVQTVERERDALRAELLKFRVATKFGISDEDADLFLTGTDEDTLTKQAQRLAARTEDAGKPRAPKPDRNQGRPSGGAGSTADQFAAAIQSAF